jgi:hypothetical protein
MITPDFKYFNATHSFTFYNFVVLSFCCFPCVIIITMLFIKFVISISDINQNSQSGTLT